MKPYGIPINDPNLGELGECHALKSCVYRLPGRGGDIRAQHRSKSKRRMRRIWKRRARATAQKDIRKTIGEQQ